ncbi:MAG: glycoside hydrolase family 5 protein [Pseudomonadota bacterium]
MSRSHLGPAPVSCEAVLRACGVFIVIACACARLSAQELPPSPLERGVNFGNMLEAPNEGDWGLTLEAEYFARVSAVGFDHIRLPVSWTYHTQAKAPYRIDPAFLSRVVWAIEQARARGLAVVVNDHHHDELNADPDAEGERALAIWRQLAHRLRAYDPDQVYFELLNEPHGAFNANPERWNAYLAEALAVVRAIDPDRPVLAGPVQWNSVDALDAFEPPDDAHLIATVHFYEPFGFTHQGAEWIDPIPPLGVDWIGTRYALGWGWENWSWDTTTDAEDAGMRVTFDAGWAGLALHRGSPLDAVDSLTVEVDQALSLSIRAGMGDDFAVRELQSGPGVNRYTVTFDPPLAATDIHLQNNTPDPQAPFTVSFLEVTYERNESIRLLVDEAAFIAQGLALAERWAVARRLPLYVGEFGAYSRADTASRVRWTGSVREQMEGLDLGFAYWEFGAGFGLYDPEAGRWRAPLLNSVLPR